MQNNSIVTEKCHFCFMISAMFDGRINHFYSIPDSNNEKKKQ